ncbi:MAG: elongation factor 4, partial [Parcubacteria group bacterium]|nr:elongation factor 4 [Parcubacteria group bacterium]
SASSLRVSAGVSDQVESREYILNLIDTPGHVDFSYEVSRALAAVEGAILLVDGTQGVQAQTLAHLELAKKEGLTILGAINKIDLLVPSLSQLKDELAGLIGCTPPEIFAISGKTGTGVADLLEAVVARVPPPSGDPAALLRALIFDSIYDTFQGAVAYVRVVDGSLGRNEMVRMVAAARNAKSSEIGFFKPQRVSTERLSAGEIGYVATSIKEVGAVRVGDTLTTFVSRVDPLPGYAEPKPMVFAGFYPKDAKELTALKDALAKLKLNDAALMFEPCRQEALGQGFRVGFLGALHLEIVKERVAREYALEPFITLPSVWYKVKSIKGEEVDVFTPGDMPPEGLVQEIREPWVALEIIAREEDMQSVMKLVREKRGVAASFETMGSGRITIKGEMPLAELIVDFHDRLKSVSRGFASMSYTLVDWRPGDLVKLDILIAGELHDAFSRIVPRLEAERAGRRIVEKLKEILPREVFSVPLQAAVGSRILARSTMPALKKDVTGHLYGGDRTRKMKLWKKQQEGKKRLREIGRVEVPSSAFFEILKLG